MNFDVNYSKLKNGVRVLTIPMPGVESVTTMILVKTGSRNETKAQAGISHVLEHMVFKGTKKYPTPMALAEAVDGVGAEQNAFTSKEYTGFYITSAAKHVPLALDVQSEMLMRPKLPAEDLTREQGVIIEEINMYEDHPMERAGEEFENLMYDGSSMGRLIIGTKETVRATTSDSLRKYMGDWYRGGNVLVVVAGKGKILEERREILELVDEKFGGMGVGEIAGYTEPGVYGTERFVHVKKETEQAHFVMGVPGIPLTDPRRYSLQLAQVILGGSMSSRLFNEIREKRGLAYYVSSSVDMAYDCGYFSVRAGVKLANLGEAMGLVKDEMLKLGETFTNEELSRAKEYVLGHLPLQLEDTMGVAQFFATRALVLDEIRQPDEVVKAVQAVTLADVQSVLKELVKEGAIRTVVVGPKAS